VGVGGELGAVGGASVGGVVNRNRGGGWVSMAQIRRGIIAGLPGRMPAAQFCATSSPRCNEGWSEYVGMGACVIQL